MYTQLPLDEHVSPRGGGDLPFLRGRRERGRIKKPAYARKIWRGIACFGNRIIGSWLWIIQCFILLQYNAVDSSFLKRAPADGGLLVSEFIVMDVNKLASNLEVYKNGTDKSNNDLNETEGGSLNSPFSRVILITRENFLGEDDPPARRVNEFVLHTENFAVGSSFSIGSVDYRWKKRSWRKNNGSKRSETFVPSERSENWLASSRERKRNHACLSRNCTELNRR